MSTCTITQALRRIHLMGSIAKAAAVGRGRCSVLHPNNVWYLITLSQHNPAKFLDKYQDALDRFWCCPVHITTIHQAFALAKINLKRVQKIAAKRDPLLESDFIRRISPYPAHYLVTVDEMSKDDHTYARMWGCSLWGCRTEVKNPFIHKRRFTVIRAMALDEGVKASCVLEGSSDHDTFYVFLEKDLLPVMNPYPAPCSVLLLDNARIHHSEDIQGLVASYGAETLLLCFPLMCSTPGCKIDTSLCKGNSCQPKGREHTAHNNLT
ncbi:unnamed protein product [Mycena citricolor]|uniref:Tc1-like transposase DDE domain-containing protein n=1 Tax=Mycena citricolor TaxID=2018698 RepID=A0AAD2K5X4_9AGAR|nr:unnamed protein product [Mycena citricolor]